MIHNFAQLSPSDLEDLARDLLGREIGVRFEAFSEGRDDGMDGRHAGAAGDIILQVKHYYRSGFSKLQSTMKKERLAIDVLQPKRYILVTSTPLTPARKEGLASIIGPALLTSGDIFGPEDLNGLLRKYPDIETAHQKLWNPSTGILRKVVAEAVAEALPRPAPVPLALALASLLAPAKDIGASPQIAERDVIFILKSSPADDEFALWLAPKLEAEGYRVFADILTLEPGDRWRREISRALTHRAVKVLLVWRGATADDDAIQDDLDVALEAARACGDSRFIVPLRLGAGQKIKGIGDAVAIDFVRGWGEGLKTLLDSLRRQRVPRRADVQIDGIGNSSAAGERFPLSTSRSG